MLKFDRIWRGCQDRNCGKLCFPAWCCECWALWTPRFSGIRAPIQKRAVPELNPGPFAPQANIFIGINGTVLLNGLCPRFNYVVITAPSKHATQPQSGPTPELNRVPFSPQDIKRYKRLFYYNMYNSTLLYNLYLSAKLHFCDIRYPSDGEHRDG